MRRRPPRPDHPSTSLQAAWFSTAKRTTHEFDVIVVRDQTPVGGDMLWTGLVISNFLDAGVKLWLYFENREVTLDGARTSS